MAQDPDNKPIESKSPVPGDGEKPPKLGPDGKPERVIDSTTDASWQSHKTPTKSASDNAKKPWFSNMLIIIPLVVLLIVGMGIGTILFLRKPSVKQAIKDTTGIDLQSLGGEQLGKVVAGNVGRPNETLTISADTVFKGKVDFGDTATIQGATTSKGVINALGGLNVSGAVTFDSITSRGALNVAGGSTLQGDVNINNLLTVRQALNVLGNSSIGGGLSVGGSLSVGGALTAQKLEINNFVIADSITILGHIVTGGDTPTTVVFPGSGATSASHVSGNDSAGTVVIESGAGGLAATQLITVTFRKTFGSVPKVILTPVGSSSAKLQYYTSRTPQAFTIYTNTASPAGPNTYAYDYIVIQ